MMEAILSGRSACAPPRRLIAGACVLSLLFVVAAGLTGCEQPDAPAWVASAKRSIDKRDYAAAIIELKNALELQPTDAGIRWLLVQTLAASGQVIEAEKAIRRAKELGQPKLDWAPLLGRVLLDREDFQGILDQIKQDSADPAELTGAIGLLRAAANLKLGKFREARAAFSSAASAKPVEAALGVAQVLLAEGNLDEAERALDALVRGQPQNAAVLKVQGDLLGARGKSDEALQYYRKAAALAPGDVDSSIALAMAEASGGSVKKAREALAAPLRDAPQNPQVNYARAYIALRDDNIAECRAALAQVFDAIPRHMPASLLMASLNFRLGALETARLQLYNYLKQKPNDLYARKLLAGTLLRSSEPDAALQLVQPFIDAGVKDWQIIALAGEAYYRAGKIDLAIQYLERAHALQPDDTPIRSTLAAAYLAAGHVDRAFAELDSLVSKGVQDLATYELLVTTLISRNQADQALKTATDYAARQSKSAGAATLLGSAHRALKNPGAARRQFESALRLDPNYFPAISALAELDVAEGKAEAAKERFRVIGETNPSNVEARLALARLDSSLGQYSDAETVLVQTSKDFPDSSRVFIALAELKMSMGKPAEAVLAARKARELAPGDTNAMRLHASALMASGDATGAATTFSLLAAAQPTLVDAQIGLASAYVAAGTPRTGITTLRKALIARPGERRLMSSLAFIYLSVNQVGEALELAREMQKGKDVPPDAYLIEGDAMMRQSSYAEAVAAYSKALALQETGMTLARLHEAKTKQTSTLASLKPLLDWLARNPQDLQAHQYVAGVYFASGDWPRAIERYENILRIDAKNVVALNNLALAYQQSADARAIQYARGAYRLAPNSAAVADTLGSILLSSGNVEEALGVLEKAAQLDKNATGIQLNYARVLLRVGERDAARRQLKSLTQTKMSPESRKVAETLLREIGQ